MTLMSPGIQTITDPRKAKALANETRLKILQEIASNPQSISQLAKKLSVSPVAVLYHIKKLNTAGFIKISNTKVVNNNLTEKFYELTKSEYLVVISGEPLTKGPVPPKKFSEKFLLGVTPNDIKIMFDLLNLKYLLEEKEIVECGTLRFLEILVREVGAVQKEIITQLNLKLSPMDRSKIEYAAMAAVPIAFDKVLSKQETLDNLCLIIRRLQKNSTDATKIK